MQSNLNGTINQDDDIYNITKNINNPQSENIDYSQVMTGGKETIYFDRYIVLDLQQNNTLSNTNFSMVYDISSFLAIPHDDKNLKHITLKKEEEFISGDKKDIFYLLKHVYSYYRASNNRYRYLRYFKRDSFRPCMQIQG